LTRLGFLCSHSATYQDPVTQFIRQYDIRAIAKRKEYELILSVECKNVRPNYPLLVTAVPRTKIEAFHQVIVIFPQRGNQTETRKIDAPSCYKIDQMVGKAVTQVGRTKAHNELTGDDSDTFGKISQAINSAEELVVESLLSASPPFIRVIVPVLVVPTGTLFQIDYDATGKIIKKPHLVKEATLFIDHAWSTTKVAEGKLFYSMSHLHIVSFDALETVTEHWMGAEGFSRSFTR
jgi:hypothetical protein